MCFGIGFWVLGFGFWVWFFWGGVGVGFWEDRAVGDFALVPVAEYLIEGFRFTISGSVVSLSSFRFPLSFSGPCFVFRGPHFVFCVSGSVIRVSVSGFRDYG